MVLRRASSVEVVVVEGRVKAYTLPVVGCSAIQMGGTEEEEEE